MNDTLNHKDIFARLASPFHPNDIEWRAGATNGEKTKALALAYITSRAVMDRLDEIIGPENWKDEYAPGPDGGVICGLSLRINDEWITKWDGAENTDFEAVKGGLSDAFKRAGYKWGIGRYLYKLDSAWVPCEAHGKTIVLKNTPSLPSWALPVDFSGSRSTPAAEKKVVITEQDLLHKMGYDTPVSQPEPMKAAAAVDVKPSNGNGQAAAPVIVKPPASNGKRPTSWSADVVKAVLNSKLAASAPEAVRLLNESGLDASATPEQALNRIREMLKS